MSDYRDPLPGFDYTSQTFARMLGIAPSTPESATSAPAVTPDAHCATADAYICPLGGQAAVIRRYRQLEQVGEAVYSEACAWFTGCRARELEQSREEGL